MEERFQKTLKTRILQQIMAERRTVRAFDTRKPDPALVEEVLAAGQLAPHVVFGKQKDEIRRFYVFPAGTVARAQIEQALQNNAAAFEKKLRPGPHRWWFNFWERVFRGYAFNSRSIEMMRLSFQQTAQFTGHFANLSSAPLLIIVAEQRRGPSVSNWLDRQSLAHCLQNMWLMATALELAFQPVSGLALLFRDPAACTLLNLPPAQYAFDGFLLGYPAGAPHATDKAAYHPEDVIWFHADS
ncbi:nitroreductase family protein [Ornatilinea apprima]|uniref:nitroreductase family protein n=1 Tax=Ornatilinea apprima TaxID=1134406 RepID=UPI0009461544|nr:nitroreductase family protein [Ornatilinea apprima]